MYKILLVDDEILIREKIAQKIPWEELGFELVAACENGQEAMEILEKEPIDVVLTDICMPYMDGLELAKIIYEKNMSTRVVILSGYAEFEYAKMAMQYRVYSYLLKPVTSKELIQAIKEQKKSLDKEKKSREDQTRFQDNYGLLRAKILMKIASGDIDEEQVQEELKAYGGEFYKQDEVCCAAILCPSVRLSDYQKDELETQIREYSSGLLIFRGLDNEFVLFGRESNSTRLSRALEEAAAFLNEYIQKKYKAEISLLAGNCVLDYGKLHLSFKNAQELKEFLYLDREDRLYIWDDYNKSRQERSFIDGGEYCEKDVLAAIQSNLSEDVRKCVHGVIEQAQMKWHRKQRVISIYQSMLIFVFNAFQRMGMECNQLFLKEQVAFEELYQSESIKEMAQITLDNLMFAMEIYNVDRENYGERQAAMAVE